MTHTMRMAAAVRSAARKRVMAGITGPGGEPVSATDFAAARASTPTMSRTAPRSARSLAVASPGRSRAPRAKTAGTSRPGSAGRSGPTGRSGSGQRGGVSRQRPSSASRTRRPLSAQPVRALASPGVSDLLDRQVQQMKGEIASEDEQTLTEHQGMSAAAKAAATITRRTAAQPGVARRVAQLSSEYAANARELEQLFKERIESEARVAELASSVASRSGGRSKHAAGGRLPTRLAAAQAAAEGGEGGVEGTDVAAAQGQRAHAAAVRALEEDSKRESSAAQLASTVEGDKQWADAVRSVARGGSAATAAEEQRISYTPGPRRAGAKGGVSAWESHDLAQDAGQEGSGRGGGRGGAADGKRSDSGGRLSARGGRPDAPAVRKLLMEADDEKRRARRDALAARARNHGKSIAKQRMEEEAAQRAAEEEAHLNYTFKAKPIPETTQVALFEQIMAQQDTRRRLNHEARRSELQEKMKPFERLSSHEARDSANAQARRQEILMERERERREMARFRANPIPATVQGGGQAAIKAAMDEREQQRREAAARRAAETLAAASLPPRMALWQEAAAKREMEKQARARARGRERGGGYRGGPTPAVLQRDGRTLRYRYHNEVPDFHKKQAKFESTLMAARQSRPATAPEPFSFVTDEAQRREEEKRHGKLAKAQAKWAEWHGEGDDGLGGTLPLARLNRSAGSASSLHREEDAYRALNRSWDAAPVAPPSMTRSVQLRMAATQAKLREQQITQQQLAAEAEARAEAAKAAAAAVTPLVRNLEESRLQGRRLAWQIDDDTDEAKARRRKWKAEAAVRARKNAERIRQAQERRPALLTRDSNEAKKAAAGQRALLKVASALRDSVEEEHLTQRRTRGTQGVMDGVFSRNDMGGLAEMAYVGGHASAYAALAASTREEEGQ